jgi:hypothetical protein
VTIIHKELWPLFCQIRTSAVFLVDLFKGKQYSNNPRTEDDLKENSKSTLHCFHCHKKNFDVQGQAGVLDVNCECMLAECKRFSSAFLKRGE